MLLGILSLCTSAARAEGAPPAPAAEKPAADWPEGWLFRVATAAKEKAASQGGYDLTFEHAGLAQPDARDVRITTADGKPVSFFIAYADESKVRVIFDGDGGGGGPGEYRVYFGNLASQPPLPPLPPGVSAFGRKDWQPAGGYTAISYPALPGTTIDKKDTLSARAVLDSFKKLAAACQAEADKQKNPAERDHYVHPGRFRTSNEDQGGFAFGNFHIFRAEISAEPGEYEIAAGSGAATELGVLFLDGDYDHPVIEGYFKTPEAYFAAGSTGKMTLSAKPHVLEFYTTRRAPDLKLRAAGKGGGAGAAGGGKWLHLTGADAHFDAAIV
ncbi:MAG TPA: hypothetical protein VIL86_03960, partial [Tepidisphaeraceae bacterium]